MSIVTDKAKQDKKAAAADDKIQIVVFHVGEEEYGLDLNFVSEVVRPLKITPLPRMPEFVEGVINLRGTIIPVVDLRKRFELVEIRDNLRKMRMVITRGAVTAGTDKNRQLLALVVDAVEEVLFISKNDIDRPPEAAKGPNADFISGVCKLKDRLIVLIDIARVLSRQERAALAEAGHG